MIFPLLAALVAEPIPLDRALAEAFVRSPRFREAERAYKEAENEHRILLAEQGIIVRYRGDATREFDQDRNLSFTVDVPALGTEASRLMRLDNRLTLERTLPTGGEIDLAAGLRQTEFSSTRNPESRTNRSNFEIEITQPLFRANEFRLKRERSEGALLSAGADLRIARAELAKEALSRFLALYDALGESESRRLALIDSERAFEAAHARLMAGEATALEEEEAALALEDARLAILENEAEILRARGEFEEMTGIPGATTGGLGGFESGAIPSIPEDLREHPRRVRAANALEGRRISLIEVRSRRAPQLDLTGRHAWEGDERTGLTSNFLRSWTAGLRVNVPLYDGRAGRREIENSVMNLDQARENLVIEESRIRLEARTARISAEVALERRRLATRRRKQAEGEARAAEARYRVGEGTLTDLLQRNSRLADARIAEVRSRGDSIRTLVDYLAAIGVDPYEALRGRAGG